MKSEVCSSRISGIGSYLPAMRVSSADLMREARCEDVGYRDRFLERTTGIKERRFAGENDTLLSMAINAASNAISDSGINPLDLDLVIYCGIESVVPEPATAVTVQNALNATNARAFDVSNACIGLLDGVSIANAFIASGSAENVLVCTAEMPSKVSFAAISEMARCKDKERFKHLLGALTVGDAAGAFVVTKSDDASGFKYMKSFCNSENTELCYYSLDENGLDFAMDMEELSRLMGLEHGRMYEETIERLGWQRSDVDLVASHQVGRKAHDSIRHITKLGLQNVPQTYDYYANVTSATPAVVLEANRPNKGDKVILLGAGSGWTICQMGLVF